MSVSFLFEGIFASSNFSLGLFRGRVASTPTFVVSPVSWSAEGSRVEPRA